MTKQEAIDLENKADELMTEILRGVEINLTKTKKRAPRNVKLKDTE